MASRVWLAECQDVEDLLYYFVVDLQGVWAYISGHLTSAEIA